MQNDLAIHLQSGSKKQIRFRHGSTNSTRPKEHSKYKMIDTSFLNEIISIDPQKKIAIVESNVPMDQLLAATLQYNLMPQVVVEFPGITVGGAVQGAALESSSFRYGQFDDGCLAYEVITADGVRRIKNSPDPLSFDFTPYHKDPSMIHFG